MKIKIYNPDREFLVEGKEYLAESPNGNQKRVILCSRGFSALNDQTRRFLQPTDPLFWWPEKDSEILEIEVEAKEYL